MKHFVVMVISMFLLTTINMVLAAEPNALIVKAAPKKTVCDSAFISFNEESVKAEICVTQGSFSPDRYLLKFNRDTVLQGIDDQTTMGISNIFKAKAITLQCTPLLVKGDATADEIKTLLPSYSSSKVKELADLMKGSKTPVEVARNCVIDIDKSPALKAQVFFD
jgi:hypothetical protein